MAQTKAYLTRFEDAKQYISWVCPSEGTIEEITEKEYVSRFQSGADAAHERIRKGHMEIQITTPEEGVNYLTIDGVLCSIEWDIRNSKEFKRRLEINPDLALAWRDSSIVVEQTFAKRSRKFDDPRRSRSFCEFGEHTINIEQHGGTVCYSHRDLNVCARCYVQHVEEYFGVDAPGAARTRQLYGWISDSDAAHERRMLKRQLRRAGVEWDRDLPNTAEALRDQIRALGLEPMEVCFHRSIECPACVLPSGHEGPHEPTSARNLESLSDYALLDGRYRKREGIRAEQLRRAALVREGEKVRRANGDIATAEQLAALASDLEAGVRNSPKVSIAVPVEPKKSVRKSTVNAPDLSLFD